MRRITSVLIILVMALTLFGCQSQPSLSAAPTTAPNKATSDSSESLLLEKHSNGVNEVSLQKRMSGA